MIRRKGYRGQDIAAIKRRLSVFPVDEDFDEALAQRVRGIQAVFSIPITGALDVETAEAAGVLDLFVEPSWT